MSSQAGTGVIGLLGLIGISAMSGMTGAYLVAPDARRSGERPARVNQPAYVADSSGREALEGRLAALEGKVSSLSAMLELRASTERAHCLAAVDAVRDEITSEVDGLAEEIDEVREGSGNPSVASADAEGDTGNFASYLDATAERLENGALAPGAEVVFERLGVEPGARSAVASAAQGFLAQRIDELRAMSETFDRMQGQMDTAASSARLKQADEQLLAQLQTHLNDEQAQTLFPMIQNIVGVPPHLVGSDPEAR